MKKICIAGLTAIALAFGAFPASAPADVHYVHGLPAHRVWVWPHYNCHVVGGADGTVAVTSCIWRGGGWHWKINGAPNP